jgi:hypothetical protein
MNIIFLVGVDLTTKSLNFFENILLQSVPQVPPWFTLLSGF